MYSKQNSVSTQKPLPIQSSTISLGSERLTPSEIELLRQDKRELIAFAQKALETWVPKKKRVR